MLQVAQGRRIASASGEEVFIQTQDLWTGLAAEFGGFQLQMVLEPPLHRGRPDLLAFGQGLPADPVIVQPEDLPPERFGAAPPRLNARKALVEVPATVPALELAGLQMQVAMA